MYSVQLTHEGMVPERSSNLPEVSYHMLCKERGPLPTPVQYHDARGWGYMSEQLEGVSTAIPGSSMGVP